MRIAGMKSILTYLVVLNFILIAIGTIMTRHRKAGIIEWSVAIPNKTLEVIERPHNGTDVTSSPVITTIAKDTKTAEFSGFNRTKWSDVFSFTAVGDVDSNFNISESLKNRDFVLGIPTISRKRVSYLKETLQSLLDNLEGYQSVLIVVYIGEDDPKKVSEIYNGIKETFLNELKIGLIKVIFPPRNYYPAWTKQLRKSFNDEFTRVKWRSKQNLDQLYLMRYAYSLNPKYYLMLEDDIIAATLYLHKIYKDAESKKDRNYVLISYCQLGAIGKLIPRDLLLSFSTYLELFWGDKPLDWLIADYIQARVCDIGKSGKDCKAMMSEVQLIYKPSLFQHIGTSSSYPGKIQTLKDKAFRKS